MERHGSSYATMNRGGGGGGAKPRSSLFSRSPAVSHGTPTFGDGKSKMDVGNVKVPRFKHNTSAEGLERLKVKVANVWLSPEIGGELNQHLITGVIVSVLALGIVLLSFAFGTRVLPVNGVVPSYGFVYNIPDIFYILICMIVTTTRNPNIVRYVGTTFSYAFLLLEIFSFSMNLSWFIMNLLGTLPRAATIGQTLFGTLFLVLGNFLIGILLLWNCVRLTQVAKILPERLALVGQLIIEESDSNIPLTTVEDSEGYDTEDDNV
jgi:hypothetical protein